MQRLFIFTLLLCFTFADKFQLAPPPLLQDIPLIAKSKAEKPQYFGLVEYMGKVNFENMTITLPLYEEVQTNQTNSTSSAWFIFTDASNKGVALRFGINFSWNLKFLPKSSIGFANISTIGNRQALTVNRGSVDFSQNVKAGSTPGSVGSGDYSPFIQLRDLDVIWNAPIIASGIDTDTLNNYCNGITDVQAYKSIHDQVVSICPRDQTVTFRLTPGFSLGRGILYLSLLSSNRTLASLTNSTYAPSLSKLGLGSTNSSSNNQSSGDLQEKGSQKNLKVINDALPQSFSPLKPIYIISNGYSNEDLNPQENCTCDENNSSASLNLTVHPLRQGLLSAIEDKGYILPIFSGVPALTQQYCPLRQVYFLEWKEEAIQKNLRTRLIDETETLSFVFKGLLSSPESSGGSSQNQTSSGSSSQNQTSNEVNFNPSGTVLNFPIAGRLW